MAITPAPLATPPALVTVWLSVSMGVMWARQA